MNNVKERLQTLGQLNLEGQKAAKKATCTIKLGDFEAFDFNIPESVCQEGISLKMNVHGQWIVVTLDTSGMCSIRVGSKKIEDMVDSGLFGQGYGIYSENYRKLLTDGINPEIVTETI